MRNRLNADPPPTPAQQPPKQPGGAPGILTQTTAPAGPLPAPKAVQTPTAKKYRVMVGGYFVQNGMRSMLRAGKLITEAQYDFRQLRMQGIQIAEEEGEPVPAPPVPEAQIPPQPPAGE